MGITAMKRIAASITFAFVLLGGPVCPARGAQQHRGLTLGQIEQLIHIHTPDSVVAGAIRSRGLDFTPTPGILEDLQKRGAGQATLAAIRARMPVGTLEIDAAPGSQITLDGTERGPLNSQGRLVLSGLPAGPHHLLVSRANYQPGEFTLTLAANQYKRFPVHLNWAGGYLSVQVDRSGSAIQVAGLGQYRGTVSNLRCPAGRYEITVTHAGMKQETRSVDISTGQHASVEIHLAPDPQWVASRLKDAEGRRNAGDISGAVQAANEILRIDPTNSAARASAYRSYLVGGNAALRGRNWMGARTDFKAAEELNPSNPVAWQRLGLSALPLGQWGELPSAWDKSLAQGGTLTLQVWHYAGFHIPQGVFRLNSKAVTFTDSKGKTAFSVSPSQVSALRSHHPPLGGAAWSFGMKVKGHRYWFSFVPIGIQCKTPIMCSNRAGYIQEGVVSNYIVRTIPKLASGSLGPNP